MKNLFISFDDDRFDPTYTSAFVCLLISSPNIDDNVNPCGEDNKEAIKCDLVPTTEAELRKFAKMFGWTVKVESGTMILVTDINTKE